MKNMIESFNIRLYWAEERIRQLEDMYLDIMQFEEKKEIRMKKSEKKHICSMGYHKVKQYLHYGSTRRKIGKERNRKLKVIISQIWGEL